MRENINFKNGDLVRVRAWDDLESEFGTDNDNEIRASNNAYGYRLRHRHHRKCAKAFVLTDFSAYHRWRRVINDEFYIDADKIEMVEEGYLERVQLAYASIKEEKANAEVAVTFDREKMKANMIKKVDKVKMKKIIAGSLNTNMKNLKGIDKNLEDWAEAKVDIYMLLGEQLKISKVVAEEMNEDNLSELLQTLKVDFPPMLAYIDRFPTRDYISNQVDYIPDDYADYFEISKGMKLSKFFSKNFKNEEFDIALSKIMQNTSINGNVVISIDPIDYLLMSNNVSGWNSCHAILHKNGDQGCYSGGIFSYMCDTTTLISYKHSDTVYKYKFKNFQISEHSKNWRMCIYYHDESKSFITSRQYPNNNDDTSRIVREMFEEQITTTHKAENKWKVSGETSDIRQYVEDASSLHYNDVLRYDQRYKMCHNQAYGLKTAIRFVVGSEPKCPVCGEETIRSSEYTVCRTCRREM